MGSNHLRPRTRRPSAAFTLIELLVVVAIISLLISILLPNLACARDQARAAKCGVLLRAFGVAMNAYATEQGDWFPGPNSTGITLQLAMNGFDTAEKRDYLKKPSVPISNWDWMTPSLAYDSPLSGTRAEKYRTVMTDYACPSQATQVKVAPFPNTFNNAGAVPDKGAWTADINAFGFYPMSSYMLSGPIAMLGRGNSANFGANVSIARPGQTWDIQYDDYTPRLSKLGQAAEKVYVADGMRYLDRSLVPDFDAAYVALYSSFGSGGAWYSRDTAYGARSGSKTWDGETVGSASQGSAAEGEQLALSYRHGCIQGQVSREVQGNKGSMNAVFFDGHVARMNDRESRDARNWYPKGAVRKSRNDVGMTDVPSTPGQNVIP